MSYVWYNYGMKKLNILIVDHICHKMTKSFDFLIKLLSEQFDVDVFYYEKHGVCRIPSDQIARADWVVFLEFLPWRFRLGVSGKKCLFVPMYDNEWSSVWQWRRIAKSRMSILSFSSHVTNHALRYGVEPSRLLDVRFAPNPEKYQDMQGDPRKLLLWERGDISFDTIKKCFAPGDLDKILILRHPDERISYSKISDEDKRNYNVEVREVGFLPEDEYKALMSECGLYVAPRLKEGIGMAFLEAMAMGKVVIAHNEGTMNEVIEHGKNGWLLNMRKPMQVDLQCLIKIHQRGFDRKSAYMKWCEDAKKIPQVFQDANHVVLLSPMKVLQILRYVCYLFEGCLMRMREYIRNMS